LELGLRGDVILLLLLLSSSLSLSRSLAPQKQGSAKTTASWDFSHFAKMATPATRARSLALYRALMRSAKAMPTYNRQEHVMHKTRQDVSPALALPHLEHALLHLCMH
jgi:Complex 1 protein (LYR family)